MDFYKIAWMDYLKSNQQSPIWLQKKIIIPQITFFLFILKTLINKYLKNVHILLISSKLLIQLIEGLFSTNYSVKVSRWKVLYSY